MSLSTIHVDADDILGPTHTNYRRRIATISFCTIRNRDQLTCLSQFSRSFDDTDSSLSPKINKRLCLVILALVLILLTLISIAGLIIAIYSLADNSRNANILLVTPATYSTTTVNGTATTTSLQCSSSPTTSYVYSTGTPSQCVNYTLNTDETRNVAYGRSINACDNISPFNSTTPVWIRFQDPAGGLMANSPVPPNSCGTVATGWYAGQYPNAFFSTATSIVCYYYSTNTCAACNLISITNCQTFYVFLLTQPPSCNYRYCTLWSIWTIQSFLRTAMTSKKSWCIYLNLDIVDPKGIGTGE